MKDLRPPIRQSPRPVLLSALAACLLLAATTRAQDTVQTMTLTRTPVVGSPPVQQSFIVTATSTPPAIVILLSGSDGNIQLTPTVSPDGTLDVNSNNFLVRSRWLFAGHGLYTITLDSATDFQQLSTGLKGEEGSTAHVSDVMSVISSVRSTLPGVPVWIAGTSRGTAGAFVAAANSPGSGGPDGLIFTDAINSTTDPDSLLMATLANITVPVLLLEDAGNTCAGTLASGNPAVQKALKNSPKVTLQTLAAGGLTALTDNCHALSDHGFFGVESTAVHDIVLFIGSTETALSSSPDPSISGSSVTFTATVSYFARNGTPTGKVTFRDLTTNTTLGSATLSGGSATLATSALLAVGNHSIVAIYGGDANSTTSTSAKLVQQVTL